MKRLYRSALVPGILALAMAMIFRSYPTFSAEIRNVNSQISASADKSAASQATIDTPGTGIETVPADDVPIEQAPSSKNNNDAMVALLEFVVLWSVIYMVIKLVRKKLEKDKPYK